MRAKVNRLEVDIDLISSNEDLLEAAGAALHAGFDFSGQRAGQRGVTQGFPGLVRTELTDPGVFLESAIVSLVVLEAALDNRTPEQVLDRVRRQLTSPEVKIPTAQMVPVEDEDTAGA